MHRNKKVLNIEAPNNKLSLGICINEEEDPSSDLMGDGSPL
jgi:hypothetical protein